MCWAGSKDDGWDGPWCRREGKQRDPATMQGMFPQDRGLASRLLLGCVHACYICPCCKVCICMAVRLHIHARDECVHAWTNAQDEMMHKPDLACRCAWEPSADISSSSVNDLHVWSGLGSHIGIDVPDGNAFPSATPTRARELGFVSHHSCNAILVSPSTSGTWITPLSSFLRRHESSRGLVRLASSRAWAEQLPRLQRCRPVHRRISCKEISVVD
jgi:hypothetical protein